MVGGASRRGREEGGGGQEERWRAGTSTTRTLKEGERKGEAGRETERGGLRRKQGGGKEGERGGGGGGRERERLRVARTSEDTRTLYLFLSLQDLLFRRAGGRESHNLSGREREKTAEGRVRRRGEEISPCFRCSRHPQKKLSPITSMFYRLLSFSGRSSFLSLLLLGSSLARSLG